MSNPENDVLQTGDPELDALLQDGEDPMQLLRNLKMEQVRRLEGRKFSYYEPNGKCEEFINKFGSNKYFITFFSAANGVGKTAASANIVAHMLFPHLSENPYFKALPLFQEWPYPKRGRIVTDPNNISNVIAALKEWLPKGHYTAKKGTKSFESIWTAGEWTIEIMSYEQDAKEFEGPTLGFVWFDEPPPQAIYKACVSRLRLGGRMFISATPLKGSGWMYDAFVVGDTEAAGLQEGEKILRSFAHIEADVEAACIEHGTRGHLRHEDIELMVAEYDEEEREARVRGKFQDLTGLVFKKWKKDVHVIQPFHIDKRRFAVYHALDPHPRTKDAGLWVAVDEKGRKFVCDELWLTPPNGTEGLADAVKAKHSSHRIIRQIIDPSALIEDQHTQKSLQKSLAKFGLNYLPAPKERAAANRRIDDAMVYNRLPTGEFIREPELFVFSTCTRLIWEIEHWKWDEWTGKTGEKKDRKETPVDKDDHMIECLGRILFQEPVFVPYIEPVYHHDTQNEGRMGSADPF